MGEPRCLCSLALSERVPRLSRGGGGGHLVSCHCVLLRHHMPSQGYASGCLDADAMAVRVFEQAGVLPVVCQSYAKSMGLYGERTGAVNFVCATPDEAAAVMSQVKQSVIRPVYSSPPLHGARLAATVLGDPHLFAQWRRELKLMAGRVQRMRQQLGDALRRLGAPSPDGGDWDHITSQIGSACRGSTARPTPAHAHVAPAES